jgi:S-DNA-T family DNA segregation ATPase FtsK/SpoIIIE
MRILGPTSSRRLNEAGGFVLLFAAFGLVLSLASYHSSDPSWNTAAGRGPTRNLIGTFGSHLADLLMQALGYTAMALPVLLLALAWKWLWSREIDHPVRRLSGAAVAVLSVATLLALARGEGGEPGISGGGLIGDLAAAALVAVLNVVGSTLLASLALLLSFYLLSSFSVERVPSWMGAPGRVCRSFRQGWDQWIESFRRERERRFEARAAARAEAEGRRRRFRRIEPEIHVVEHPPGAHADRQGTHNDTVPDDIPIRTLDELAPPPAFDESPAEYVPEPEPVPHPHGLPDADDRRRAPVEYRLPPTDLLNEAEGRSPYDAQELKETAARIKSKLEEFKVLGNVVQINPGPVVTTFEFKPEAGIKYTRITTLAEDLCLGLHAESVLIERIPGKPTVGIEVPNSRRDVISLRQILESEEFQASTSRLTISLGKDINGRIKVTALEAMPHLLIAGSTGSGKSVMLNSLIMSVLYKSTPHEVRMILIDPKRVEMGMYEEIPHLLTPVITDARKATYALRNAVGEMERRLKLLAAHGVRNLEQFNRKARQMMYEPRNLFDENGDADEIAPLPYVLIVIDELSDLMMVERANVEESITRLAQMARAVGMHLVVATQRPSVDVITGLIKANFPARLSFRVATRVDSRTILDVMGAEHLLGRGDMLFLPPGSSRLVRVHGPLVTESEIHNVVAFWMEQSRPDYDESLLLPPAAEDDEGGPEAFEGADDPAYADAVRVVCEVGKASTSILQRRLRLGYGRAARLLDVMQAEGIIGPPDGSRPREVLKRPNWMDEVDHQLR